MLIQPIRYGDLIIDLDKLEDYERVVLASRYKPGVLVSWMQDEYPGMSYEMHTLCICYNVAPEVPSEWFLRSHLLDDSTLRYKPFSYESEEIRDLDYRHYNKMMERYRKGQIKKLKEKFPHRWGASSTRRGSHD